VTWDVLLVLLNPPQDFASCRAGARPGHPINGHSDKSNPGSAASSKRNELPTLLDQLGAISERSRDGEFDRVRCLEVDNEFAAGRL